MSSIEIQHGRDAQIESRAARDRELCAPIDFKNCEQVEARFEQIYQVYGHEVFEHIRGIVRNHETAEDLSQETFLRVYKAFPRFITSEQPLLRPWLYRIATNQAISHLRRGRVVSFTALTDIFPSGYEDPEGTALDNEMHAELSDAIGKLKPVRAKIITLHHLEELPYDDMVTKTGLGVAILKSQAYRGRGDLREQLSHHDPRK